MPRESELPEGTDHIINGAMETGTGGSAGGGGGGAGPGDATGIIAGGDTRQTGDDTGGTISGQGGGGEGGGTGSALREGAAQIRQQATERVRQFADDGKSRASDKLDEISRIVEEAAASIEDRLGPQYGGYARRAAEGVSGFAGTLRDREIDELYDDVRAFVRKSPGVAIGAAAAIGFVLVRLAKAGTAGSGPEAGSASGTPGAGGAKPQGGRQTKGG
jgi:ElaB/YqjD/DUF883 family membrane-anchored ribosome-binding protein